MATHFDYTDQDGDRLKLLVEDDEPHPILAIWNGEANNDDRAVYLPPKQAKALRKALKDLT